MALPRHLRSALFKYASLAPAAPVTPPSLSGPGPATGLNGGLGPGSLGAAPKPQTPGTPPALPAAPPASPPAPAVAPAQPQANNSELLLPPGRVTPPATQSAALPAQPEQQAPLPDAQNAPVPPAADVAPAVAAPQTAEQQPQQPAAPAQATAPAATPADAAAAKPTVPKTPEQQQQANTDLMQRMNDPNVPDADKKVAAQQHVQQLLDSKPEMKQGMADLHAGKNTPQAKAFQAEVDKAGNAYIREEFAKLRQQNPGATPQQQGGMLQGIMQSYQQMPEPMKWMMGIGLGGGLLGVLGSMFGGGGGMGLMGLLGLGAAGMAGAMGGMFGDGAQTGLSNMLVDAGQALGVMPGKQDLSVLTAKDPVASAVGNSGGMMSALWKGTGGVKKELAQAEQQRTQLQRLSGLPASLRNALLMKMDPTNIKSPADAERAYANSQQILKAYDDPSSEIGKKLQQGRDFTAGGWSAAGLAGRARDAAGTAYDYTLGNSYLPSNIAYNRLFGKSGSENLNPAIKRWADYDETVHVVAASMKSARCWAGYEPVPGKAPYSENSCRPVGGKQKKKKKTEKAEKTAEEVADAWIKKYRARGQKGRWVNTRRGSKTELKVPHN